MGESDVSNHDVIRSKKALEKVRRAEAALRTASAAREQTVRRLFLEAKYTVIASGRLFSDLEEARRVGNSERAAQLEQRLEEREKSYSECEEENRRAVAEEQEALDELAAAEVELEETTVEPRVEGLKLRFETRKLQATLSAAVVVGVATITEVLLPPEPNYTWLLWLTYASFLASLYGSLSDMQKLSLIVENIRISGASSSEEGRKEKWMRRVREGALKAFFAGVVLFGTFVALNLA